MDDCPKCVAGSLFWSDVYMAWECDLCEHLVEFEPTEPTLPAEQRSEGGAQCPDCRIEMVAVQPPAHPSVLPGECVYYFRCAQCEKHGSQVTTAHTLHGEQPREGGSDAGE